jgi:hypothetical protein
LYESTLIQDEALEAFQYSNMDANDPNWYKLLHLPEWCPFDKVVKCIVDHDSLHKLAVFHFARSVCCRDGEFSWLDSTFHVLNGSPGSESRHVFLAAKLSELFECIEAFRSSHIVTLALVWKGIGTTLVRSLSASDDRDELLQDEFLITLGNDEGNMRAAVLACFPRIDIDAFVNSARELARAVEQVLYRDAVQACMKLISVVIHDPFVPLHDDVLSGMCELQKSCTRNRLCEILRRFGDHASRVTALLLQDPCSFTTTLATLCSFPDVPHTLSLVWQLIASLEEDGNVGIVPAEQLCNIMKEIDKDSKKVASWTALGTLLRHCSTESDPCNRFGALASSLLGSLLHKVNLDHIPSAPLQAFVQTRQALEVLTKVKRRGTVLGDFDACLPFTHALTMTSDGGCRDDYSVRVCKYIAAVSLCSMHERKLMITEHESEDVSLNFPGT